MFNTIIYIQPPVIMPLQIITVCNAPQTQLPAIQQLQKIGSMLVLG